MALLSKLVKRGIRTNLLKQLNNVRCASSFTNPPRYYATSTKELPRPTTLAEKSDLISLCTMSNGEKLPHVFPPSEFESRLKRLRWYMAENGIGACIMTSYHNICYFTGYLYTSMGRNYACVVTPDTATTITAAVDGGYPWRRMHSENIVYTDWEKDNFFKGIKSAVGEIDGKLAVEADHISLESFSKIRGDFPRKDLVDIGQAAMRMRMVKTEAEIQLVKEGARIADLGGWAVVEALTDGAPEYEVALHANSTMVREIAQRFPGSDLQDTWTWVQSGINTDGAHNPVTSRRIRNGDGIILNCFPMIQGNYSALERTLFLDHVTDEQLRMWEVNVDVHKRGLKLIKPGVRCCDVALELNEMFREKGLLQYRTFGYGHSFGVISHYYGREAGLELREDVDTVLEPGMVVSMEPMVMIPESRGAGAGGYREHDILVVTETGAENITHFPLGPEHNIIKK